MNSKIFENPGPAPASSPYPPVDAAQKYIASRIFQFLVRSRIAWQADLERYLIVLSFIAVGYIEAERNQITIEASLQQQVRLTAQTVSDMTSIPRESARRKLDLLLSMGVLTTDEQGRYSLPEAPPGADIVKEIYGYIGRGDP